MYCRKCSYSLRGLPEHRCPECGTVFDPADRRTFRQQPLRRARELAARTSGRLAFVLAAVLAVFSVAWCALGGDSTIVLIGVILGGGLWLFLVLITAGLFLLAGRGPAASLVVGLLTAWAIWLSVPLTHWPGRAHFALYRSQFDTLADRMEAGEQIGVPLRVGGYSIIRAELDYRGIPCLWIRVRYGGRDGFVRCPGYAKPPFNLWLWHDLGGGWYLIVED